MIYLVQRAIKGSIEQANKIYQMLKSRLKNFLLETSFCRSDNLAYLYLIFFKLTTDDKNIFVNCGSIGKIIGHGMAHWPPSR